MIRLLVTGAAGEIGQLILPYLKDKYLLCGYDLLESPGYSDSVIGDISDMDAISLAMQDVDAVLHLAYPASGDFNSWGTVLNEGLDGTYKVFQAALQNRVMKIIYASTVKVNNYHRKNSTKLTSKTPPTPMDLYAGGKLMCENLAMTLTTLNKDLDIVCLRIGAIRNLPLIADSRSHHDHISWCHPQDLAQLIDRSIQTKALGFQIFFAISRNGAKKWDLETSRRIVGYKPTYHADDYFISDSLEDLPFTRNQRTVLKAALLSDQPAGKQAWKRWAASLNRQLKIPGHDSVFPIIPMASLAASHDPKDQRLEENLLLGRIAGIEKQAWYITQLHLEAANTISALLDDEHIQYMFLNDLAYWKRLYAAEQISKSGPYRINRPSGTIPPNHRSTVSDRMAGCLRLSFAKGPKIPTQPMPLVASREPCSLFLAPLAANYGSQHENRGTDSPRSESDVYIILLAISPRLEIRFPASNS